MRGLNSKDKATDYKIHTIYAIVSNFQLAYIGLTGREDPSIRFNEHLYYSEHPEKQHSQRLGLYKYIRSQKQKGYPVEFRILQQTYCSRTQAEQIEKQYITTLKPRFNIAGIKVPYNYVPKKRKKKT